MNLELRDVAHHHRASRVEDDARATQGIHVGARRQTGSKHHVETALTLTQSPHLTTIEHHLGERQNIGCWDPEATRAARVWRQVHDSQPTLHVDANVRRAWR